MTRKERYEEVLRMTPVLNPYRSEDEQHPTFAEFTSAEREGRIVLNDRKCVIVSNNPVLQFTLHA